MTTKSSLPRHGVTVSMRRAVAKKNSPLESSAALFLGRPCDSRLYSGASLKAEALLLWCLRHGRVMCGKTSLVGGFWSRQTLSQSRHRFLTLRSFFQLRDYPDAPR